MAQYDELMQRAITVRNNVAPASNTAILVGGVLVSIVSALQSLQDNKQGSLTFDTTPTDGSTNPVTSNGIYEAIAAAIANIDLSEYEQLVNKVTEIDENSTNTQYPSAAAVYAAIISAIASIDLSGYEQLVNKVTEINENSTNTQYPTAAAVYAAIQEGGGGGSTDKQTTLFFTPNYATKTLPNTLGEITITAIHAYNVTSAYYSLSSGAEHQQIVFVSGVAETEIVVPAGGWIRIEDVEQTDTTEPAAIALFSGGTETTAQQLTVFLNEVLETKTLPNALAAYTITDIVCFNITTLYYSLSSGAQHQQITLTSGTATGLNIVVPAGGWIRFEDCGRTVYNSEASIGIKYTI